MVYTKQIEKAAPGFVTLVMCCIAIFITTDVLAAVHANGAFSTSHLDAHVGQMLRQPGMHQQPVTIILESPAMSRYTRGMITRHGARFRYEHNGLYEITIPAVAVSALLNSLPDFVYARRPFHYEALAVTSQGVNISGAVDMHSSGLEGSGIKIGIIDLGFTDYTQAQSTGDLPASLVINDYTGLGYGGSQHGTKVAEVVHDMAPGAELYLARVGTEVQLQQAMEDMVSVGVDVINHSVAWFGGAFYDGTGPICDVPDTAVANGVTWVTAAGNSRYAHYMEVFIDSDGDGRHEFSSDTNSNFINLTAGVPVTLIMNWDDYPTSNVDYNIYLYDGDPSGGGNLVASSTNSQNGNRFSTPYESIRYTPASTAEHHIVVTRNDNSSENPRFAIFVLGPPLGVRTYASSLPQPGDCYSTITVGAVNLEDGIESFSSEGPTTDGRPKPDVSAPNRTVTSLTSSFQGTSAASPHVAGAAALELQRNPSLTPNQVRDLLMVDSHDVYSLAFDYRTGEGRISHDADLDGSNHDDDNCPLVGNTDQQDMDDDGLGDACDEDIDGDGLLNTEEDLLGTNPYVADSDADGLLDGEEVNTYSTEPSVFDSDGDGLNDGEEVFTYMTDPNASNLGDLAPLNAPDNIINAADLLIMMRLVNGLLTPGSYEQITADMNVDGVIDILDALSLSKQITNNGQ